MFDITIWLVLVLTFVIALIIGFLFARSYYLELRDRSMVGALRIDRSDPDGPYLFLELKTGVDDVSQRGYVTLEVRDENYISQE